MGVVQTETFGEETSHGGETLDAFQVRMTAKAVEEDWGIIEYLGTAPCVCKYRKIVTTWEAKED